MATNVLPIEVHILNDGEQRFAYDVRNFAILKVGPLVATILALAAKHDRDAISARLLPIAPREVTEALYARVESLVRSGTLSSSPVPAPIRPPFNRLVLLLAGGCNMGCSYCFEKDIPSYQGRNLMSRATADRVLDWFLRNLEGTKAHVQLYGGEPLLNWPVLTHVVERFELEANARNLRLTKYLITNGTLLNRTRIRFLGEHGVTVQVSADGDERTHNRFRVFKSGEPTMRRIRPNVTELRRQGVDFNLRAVLTRQNMSPQRVVEGLRSLGAREVSFEVVATDLPDAMLTGQDWEEFNQGYRTFLDAPLHSWETLPQELQATIVRICKRHRLFYGCGANVREVTVGPDGSIHPCQRMYGEPVSHIAANEHPRSFDRGFLTMVDERPICKNCWARYLCGGGCMHMFHVGHGSDDPMPQFCLMKRNLAEAAIRKIAEMRSRRSRWRTGGDVTKEARKHGH